jgi:hypothetical protein
VATVNQIREALAANLAGLTAEQHSAYLLTNPVTPALMIMPGPPGGGDFTEYHQAMQDGLSFMTFTVRCEVAVGLDVAAQQTLDNYLDVRAGSSVKAAVESDRTLGGLVSDLIVRRSVAGLVSSSDGSSQKLAAEWEIVVYT